jgi:hypothetical protein
MSNAIRKAKKAVTTPFNICIDRMTEPARAKAVDDALTYLGLSGIEVPRQATLATSFTMDDADEIAMIDKNETFALLRPAALGRMTIDVVNGETWKEFAIKTSVLKDDGTLSSERRRFTYVQNGMCVPVIEDTRHRESLLRSVAESTGIGFSFKQKQQSKDDYVIGWQAQVFSGLMKKRWTTALEQSGIALSLITQCGTLKEMFRLREKPEGRTRREALLHLVRGHWRTSPKTQDRIEVERYLRGATEFEWFGLQATISTNNCDL